MTQRSNRAETLTQRVAAGERVLIDGATGTELERRGVPMDDGAWCGQTAVTHGEVVQAVHVDYIEAGSEVITTDTFGSSKHVLEDSGLGDTFEQVNRAAVRHALAAREQAEETERPVSIAGSICTSFMAGNEMTPLAPERARANFEQQMEILVEEGVDLLLLEMALAHTRRVSIEVTAEAVRLAKSTGLPVWVGMSAKQSKDGKRVLLFGSSDPYDLDPKAPDETEPFDQRVLPVFEAEPDLVGIMHTDVDDCLPAVETLGQLWQGPIAAYPHSGHWDNPYWNFASVLEPETFADRANDWLAAGATIIGGCCGIGPEHIRTLRNRFFNNGRYT